MENFRTKNLRNEISVIQMGPAKVEPPDECPKNFETALTNAGFGRFNVYVIVTCVVCCISSMGQTTSMSLIFPGAQCDLDLSLSDKGALNATTYVGMIISAIFWGFLADVKGRRQILVFGHLAIFVFDVICGLSQNFWMMIFAKFCGGLISCGPFAVMMTYAAEITPIRYRSRVVLLLGSSFSLSNILIPGLAWFVMHHDLDWVLGDYFVIHSWNLFLLIMAIPSLLGGLLFIPLPESPKFLMSCGQNKEALDVFQEIYRRNHNFVEFPIKALANEKYVVGTTHKPECNTIEAQLPARDDGIADPEHKSLWTVIKDGLVQMSSIFEPAYLKNCLLVFTMQFGFLWSQNTMRLWLPSILGMIADYRTKVGSASIESADFDLCRVIESTTNVTSGNSTDDLVAVCSQVVDGDIYLNTIMVGVVGLMGYTIAGFIIDSVSHRNLICISSILSSALGCLIYQASSQTIMVVLFSVYLTLGGVTGSALIGLTVTLVPTQLRTMTLSLLMMIGRTGSIFGNFLFPWLLTLGCLPPFLSMAAILFFCGLLCLGLPKSAQIPLK